MATVQVKHQQPESAHTAYQRFLSIGPIALLPVPFALYLHCVCTDDDYRSCQIRTCRWYGLYQSHLKGFS